MTASAGQPTRAGAEETVIEAKDSLARAMTALEQALAKIWREVLDVKEVSLADNFFRRGGHSLKAMQVVARVRRELGLQITLADMFKTNDLQELAAMLGK
jgi:acyl carrier protein